MSTVHKTIAILSGDGIGPEVTRAATKVLSDCAAAFGHTFELIDYPFGGNAIDSHGEPLPAATLAGCKSADAILLGAVGGPKWDKQPLGKRPESGLLALRGGLDLYINLRPIRVRESLIGISPLRPERARGGRRRQAHKSSRCRLPAPRDSGNPTARPDRQVPGRTAFAWRAWVESPRADVPPRRRRPSAY